MSIFGKNHTNDINYLNDERAKLWERLFALENKVAQTPSTIEKEAKQALKKASEYRNRAKEAKLEAEETLKGLLDIKSKIDVVESSIKESKNSIALDVENAQTSTATISELIEKTSSRIELIEEKILNFEVVFNKHIDLENELISVDEIFQKAKSDNLKVNNILKNVLIKKDELDEIYHEIVGHNIENEETGEEERIDGLVDQLELQYNRLEESIKTKSQNIAKIEERANINFDIFIDEKVNEVANYLGDWKNKYEDYEKTIEKLLPQALTAGLSSAFTKKKEDELKTYDKLKNQFYSGIALLVLVSIIPFFINIHFLQENADWDTIINRIPRLILGILPLYLPVLWLAYSASKKMNLSKRLIEEYSHKDVLSRTFWGLSNQIDNLDDNEVGEELKMKLLYEFLVASAENPGKLISNYQSSDHPVMDVLEQSYKLDNALEKLEKIPGLSKVTELANKRNISKIKDKADKIKKGIDAVTDIVD